MNKSTTMIYLCALTLLSACWEPPYRYDVRGNGQGGVDIQHVPKEPETPPPPAPPPVTTPPVSPPSSSGMIDQQRQVEQLKEQVKSRSDENERLKQQLPTTAPANLPGKE